MGVTGLPEVRPGRGVKASRYAPEPIESFRRADLSKVLFGAFGGSLAIVAGAFVVLALSVRTHTAAVLAGSGFALIALLLTLLAAYLARAGAFSSMSAALEERERTLRITNERFQGVLDNANAAIYIKDPSSRYLLVNREFERIRAVTAEEVLGRRGNELGSAETEEEVRATDRAVIEAGAPISFEQEVQSPEGRRTYLAVKFPVQDEQGSVTAVAGISTDITDQKLALAKAMEASRHKSQFVANMSHEIRTPLNGVVGMTSLLCDTPLNPVQREYADALVWSSEALLSVINDILDFSNMEAGPLELDTTVFELRGAVEDTCRALGERAGAKGFAISHWVDPDVPFTVVGDQGRLRQILLNLLSNAVKFTLAGEVAVCVFDDGEDVVRFEVSDTGVGIQEGQVAQLFDSFVQGDQSTTRRYGGTGLGLAIARELAHRMGGEIGAEPGEECGSVFWFTAKLPAIAPSAEPVKARPELRGLRALIVGDDATDRATFENYLGSWGLACECVEQPSAAIEALERASRCGRPFELALLDLRVARPDCAQLVRDIRERPALRALRIVILSSSAPDRETLEGSPVSALLAKPVGQSQLFDAVAEAIAGAAPQVGRRPRAKTRAQPRAPRVLIAEDNEVNHAVAKALLIKQGLQSAIAHNGREAVEMAFSSDYAVILMDCQMPELDGYEATRRIRAAEGARHVPIIALTAHSMPGDRERCLAAGMDDYLSKPVRAEQLENAINRWLPPLTPAAERPDEPSAAATASEHGAMDAVELLDQATIVQLRDTLTLEMRESLTETFERSLPKCVADIVGAAQRGDQVELRRAAHLLKGSAATLGGARLRGACQRLERTGGDGDPDIDQAQLDALALTVAETCRELREQLLAV